MNIDQRDPSRRSSKDVQARVSVVQLCDLSLSIGLEVGIACQRDSKGCAIVDDDRQSIDHSGGCSNQRNKSEDFHCVREGRCESGKDEMGLSCLKKRGE